MWLTEVLPGQAPGVLRLPEQPVWISGLAYDSRQVRAQSLFFCVPGAAHDGHDFAPAAAAAGAAALVVERSVPVALPQVLVASARGAMADAAVRFHGDPTSRLSVIGITGTNGKTTTAFIVKALLDSLGERCGLLGTVKSVVGDVEGPAARTTPEAIDLQLAFASMLQAGQSSCAIEVSSHALALGRTRGVRFAATIFTNLTQDHLDFHRSMEDYFQAKRLLFVPEQRGGAAIAPLVGGAQQEEISPPPRRKIRSPQGRVQVLNVGDPYGRRLQAELLDAVTFGVECEADYSADSVQVSQAGTTASLRTPEGPRRLRMPLPGRFNLANALGALAAVHQLHGQLDRLLGRIEQGVIVPGRFQPVREGQDFSLIVDYAHTPDSLQSVLHAIRELRPARVICVVGAGGDRDVGKRPQMGRIGASLSDVLIVTSDNPRSEDPQAIVDQVAAGALQARKGDCEVIAQVDRRTAIFEAVSLARGGDALLIAGKGHEQGQELAGGVKVPFDDVRVAREALRALGGGARLQGGRP